MSCCQALHIYRSGKRRAWHRSGKRASIKQPQAIRQAINQSGIGQAASGSRANAFTSINQASGMRQAAVEQAPSRHSLGSGKFYCEAP